MLFVSELFTAGHEQAKRQRSYSHNGKLAKPPGRNRITHPIPGNSPSEALPGSGRLGVCAVKALLLVDRYPCRYCAGDVYYSLADRVLIAAEVGNNPQTSDDMLRELNYTALQEFND
jgi:hypothetical protein